MDLQVLVDALDVVENGEDIRRCLVDVELAEGRVTGDIIIAVDYSTSEHPQLMRRENLKRTRGREVGGSEWDADV